MTWRWSSLILLVTLVAWLQNFNLYFWSVKPNFSLAALIVLAVWGATLYEQIILTLFSALLLKFMPGFDWALVVLILISMTAFFVNKILPWQSLFNGGFLILAGSFLFYFLSAFGFAYNNWGVVMLEASYNLVVGIVIVVLLPSNEKEKRIKF